MDDGIFVLFVIAIASLVLGCLLALNPHSNDIYEKFCKADGGSEVVIKDDVRYCIHRNTLVKMP